MRVGRVHPVQYVITEVVDDGSVGIGRQVAEGGKEGGAPDLPISPGGGALAGPVAQGIRCLGWLAIEDMGVDLISTGSKDF